MQKPNVVLFDLDGTLLDNSEVVANAYYTGMEKLGYVPKSKEYIKSLFGRSTYNTGRGLGISEEDLPLIDQHFWDYFGNYASSLEGSPTVFDSVKEVLQLFKDNHISMGIVTSNESKSARILMKKAGLYDYFDTFIGSEDLPERKPSPEPLFLAIKQMKYDRTNKIAWFIGDTRYDVEAANAANFYSIGIIHDGNEVALREAGAQLILDSMTSLYNILLELLTR